MSELEEAIARLERAIARLEAADGGGSRAEREAESRRLREVAGHIAVRVDSALARVGRALKEEG
jgi:hypothetical protein